MGEGFAVNIGHARWYRIGLLLFLMYLTAFVDRSNIGMAAPAMVKSFGLSSTAVGVLLSAFFWGYVITMVPAGWTVSRYSAKKVIIWALVVWSIMAILTGVVTSFNALLVVRFLMGLAEGVVWPAFSIVIVNWFPDHERGRAMNFSELSLPVSAIIMAPLAGWMIHTWNYHVMFILQGLPPLIMAGLFAWLGSDSPEKDRLISNTERTYIMERMASERKTQVQSDEGTIWNVLGNYRIWILGVIYFLWINGFYSFGLWMPTLLKQLSGKGIQVVGWLSAVPFVLAVVAMLINSALSDRWRLKRMWFVAVPLLIGGFGLVTEHFIGFGLGINMLVLIISGIGIYAAFGPWWAWSVSFVPKNQAGSANGLINLLGNFGGITGPIIVGIAAHGKNVINGFYILGFGIVAAAIVAIIFGIIVRSRASADNQRPLSLE